MKQDFRSKCPINFAVEIFGDKWSLLIVRDMIFSNKHTYNDFLESNEKIATNILSSRLKMLEEMEIIQKHRNPARKTKTKSAYFLTPAGIDLIPLLVEVMLWSGHHQPGDNTAQPFIDKAHHNKAEFIRELRNKAKVSDIVSDNV